MKFRTTILLAGKTATGIKIPPEVIEGLGRGKKPPVRVTLKGYTYRSTVAVMGGDYMVGVNADVRAASGVNAGDDLEVDIEFDDQPREVTVPPDFAAALDREPGARRFFDGLSYSKRQAHVASIEGAKTDETRQRRLDKSLTELRQGRS
jgi:hypothetical protein